MNEDLATQLADAKILLANLKKSMASGILTAEDADSGRLTFRSYAEMRAARSDLEATIRDLEAALSPVTPRRTRQVVMTGRSGW